jgi:hypothetical protein
MGDIQWKPGTLTGGPIDEIFTALRHRFRGLTIERLEVRRANDDDNLWYLTLQHRNVELQMDAQPGGGPPFVLESADSQFVAQDVDTAIAKLAEWLSE